MVMWNTKNASYLKMEEYVQFHEIIKYEDILKDPAEFINQSAEKYSFPKTSHF